MKSTLTNAGKKALATACAGILALSLASCTNGDVSSAGDSRKIVGYDEINKEYRESIGKLSWPQDYTPPESMPSDSGTSFQHNIDKAKLGDPSGIQQDVTANCPAS